MDHLRRAVAHDVVVLRPRVDAVHLEPGVLVAVADHPPAVRRHRRERGPAPGRRTGVSSGSVRSSTKSDRSGVVLGRRAGAAERAGRPRARSARPATSPSAGCDDLVEVRRGVVDVDEVGRPGEPGPPRLRLSSTADQASVRAAAAPARRWPGCRSSTRSALKSPHHDEHDHEGERQAHDDGRVLQGEIPPTAAWRSSAGRWPPPTRCAATGRSPAARRAAPSTGCPSPGRRESAEVT